MFFQMAAGRCAVSLVPEHCTPKRGFLGYFFSLDGLEAKSEWTKIAWPKDAQPKSL